MPWFPRVDRYYQLVAALAVDTALHICEPFPLRGCASLVFIATDLFALTSPPQDYSYGLNDLLMAIAEERAVEYTMSSREGSQQRHIASLFRAAQRKAGGARQLDLTHFYG